MENRKELIFRLQDYEAECSEPQRRRLTAMIVADTLLAANRLLLSEGVGIQLSMVESPDGEVMYCLLKTSCAGEDLPRLGRK